MNAVLKEIRTFLVFLFLQFANLATVTKDAGKNLNNSETFYVRNELLTIVVFENIVIQFCFCL